MSINVTRSSMPDFLEYCDEISDLWESRFLTNNGLKHQKLESELLKYFDIDYLVLFTNGHLALETALDVYNLSGEVITTPFTFISTTNAIVRNNLKPVFCDIKPDDYTLDPAEIEDLITEETSAIMPVHVYGNVCDVESIQQIADRYNLKVIYDAAHTFGVKVGDQDIASFGDISMFSFHATKVFNTIEGGALTFSDKNLKEQLESLKNFGLDGSGDAIYVGSNGKMNEFQAAMGLCNLRHVNTEIAKRKLVVERYQENLANISGLKIWEKQPNITSNYAYFPVVFDGYKKSRDQVFIELKQNEINARKYFSPLISNFGCYRNEYNSDDTPIAKFVAENVLTLPLYADLSKKDVDKICEIIKK
ncbi:MAG: DegT/DnrJ/EryC1/StrS family aminotransferase [Bacteroidales bacterium]|nr:DegT/DnrJ/EryC1/StrS family aminotransferase [Bacteroidales bacterium]